MLLETTVPQSQLAFDLVQAWHGTPVFFITHHPPLKASIRSLLPNGLTLTKEHHVLICGAKGTGKSTLARFAWQKTNDRLRGFISVPCSSISHTNDLKRLSQKWHACDLYLQDLSKLLPVIVEKLPEFLEERPTLRLLGSWESEEPVPPPLLALFKKSLFIPPLRERKEDIPLFINLMLKQHPNKQVSIGEKAIEWLRNYPWPGEVVELQETILRAIALTSSIHHWEIDEKMCEQALAPKTLPNICFQFLPWMSQSTFYDEVKTSGLPTILQSLEAITIHFTLKQCNGCVSQAARLLKLPCNTLVSKRQVLQPLLTSMEGVI